MDWSLIIELFGYSIGAALIAGTVVPLIGCSLYLRRTSFYGLALPQLAACGVACGFALMPWWMEHIGLGGLDLHTAMEDTNAAMGYHMGWAALFTFGGLAALVALGRGGGSEVARVAAAFVIASAATVLFAYLSPTGEVFVSGLLRGEILAVGLKQFLVLSAVLGLALLLLIWLQNDFLIVSYDRESALVLGKSVIAIELGLALIIGSTVAVGSMTVGPVVLFGLLVIPPIAARPFAQSMNSFLALAAGFGFLGASLGIVASFAWDVPLGPCVVLACAGLLGAAKMTSLLRN